MFEHKYPLGQEVYYIKTPQHFDIGQVANAQVRQGRILSVSLDLAYTNDKKNNRIIDKEKTQVLYLINEDKGIQEDFVASNEQDLKTNFYNFIIKYKQAEIEMIKQGRLKTVVGVR
jgi:hypothetical protein